MYQVKITQKDAGQRFDKYLHRILPRASIGFLYKMLRKKNITLNDKKADGSERLVEDDSVSIYFSDETLEKFMGKSLFNVIGNCSSSSEKPTRIANAILGELAAEPTLFNSLRRTVNTGKNSKYTEPQYISAYKKIQGIQILYENDHILLADKPAGVLSQKAEQTDFSLNEWLIGYLLESGAVTKEELAIYKPSVCNRLDRNTSGIVLCSKTLKGAQLLSGLLKNRTLHKYYRLYVKGIVSEEQLIEGYLIKDEKLNRVYIEPVSKSDSVDFANIQNETQKSEHKVMKSLEEIQASYIRTGYKPIQTERDKTLLEVELFTGKTHQIRAHLASVGHPLLGDYKYGDKAWNEEYRKNYHVKAQLLHAYKVVFPQLEEPFEDISGRTFVAELPEIFRRVAGKA